MEGFAFRGELLEMSSGASHRVLLILMAYTVSSKSRFWDKIYLQIKENSFFIITLTMQ
jgi:hypothetical protein